MPDRQDSIIKITRIPIGAAARIVSIEGDRTTWERLHEVGLHIGDRLKLIREAALDGPLLVECNGHEIALGRNVAVNISVQILS